MPEEKKDKKKGIAGRLGAASIIAGGIILLLARLGWGHPERREEEVPPPGPPGPPVPPAPPAPPTPPAEPCNPEFIGTDYSVVT